MGGILHKLAQNGNEITVAYMTSGNIAVFDHDVRRYVDFLERLARERGVGQEDVPAFTRQVREFLATKQPGTVDSESIQVVKRIIREGEAVSALETIGLGARERPLPQPAVLPDGQGAEGPDRRGGCADRASTAR